MLNFISGLFGQKADSNSQPLTELVKTQGTFLVDVRTPAEFAEGSAPGAVNIPLDQLPQRLDELKDKTHIVVFCRSGARSGSAKALLNQKGYQNVTNGGTWQQVRQAVTTGK